ncbi:MAG: hypothetical protein Q4P20_06710 [Eubacteriales bacterium]|nr:hypothetical protein [Eubacteriales bacterium]
MAYNTGSVVTLGILKDAMTRLRTDYTGAVSNAGHVKFLKVDTVPMAETAVENVLYLVPGSDAAHCIAYALVDGAIVCMGETSADMADYVTTEELNTAVDTALDDSLDSRIATADEVNEMFDEVFATQGPSE